MTDYFITDVNTFTPDKIRWNIITSTVTSGSTRFPVYRACPTIVSTNGKESPLIIETDKVFTYGVQESKKIDGEGFTYSIPLSMHDMTGPTSHQEKFVAACEKIAESGRNFLIENAKAFNKDWIPSDLRRVGILWYGKENKRPTLYAKLPMERGNIACDFIRPILKNGQLTHQKVNPLLYRDVRCHVRAALRIESIFVGSKVSFQTKVYELIIYPQPSKVSLLSLTARDAEGLVEETETSDEEETLTPPVELAKEAVSPASFSITEPVIAEPVDDMPKPRRGKKKV